MKVRLDGTKFSVIFPIITSDSIENIAQTILEKSQEILKSYQLDSAACSIKLSIISYSANDTVYHVVKNIEHSLQQTAANSVLSHHNSIHADEESDKQTLLTSAIEHKNLSLALQAVYEHLPP
jgi:GGDEF domain-containing protein